MKTIYLLRHAQAEPRSENVPDKGRKLVKGGIEDSGAVAQNLREEGVMPDLIISSSAPRALETARIFAKKLKFKGPDILLKEKIYSADDARALLQIIRGMDDKYNSVMMVGHDPSLSALAQLLIKPFQFELPKAGVLGIECKKRKWADIGSENNQILHFIAPMKKKRLEKLRKGLTETLGSRLEKCVSKTLKESNAVAAARIQKTIRKRSLQIAEDFVCIHEYPLLKTLDEIFLFFKVQSIEKQD
jgi:phosphohistidine phosphatase